MARRLVVPLLLLMSLPLFAQESEVLKGNRLAARFEGARHFVIEADHPLRADEKAVLAARGIDIQDVVPGGRYLARVAPDADLTGDGLVRSMEPWTVDRKLQRSAFVAAKGRAFAPLFIVFHDDASFDQARQTIEAVGGTITSPLAVRFQRPRTLRAMVPSTELQRLAQSESVRAVMGLNNLRRETHNVISANLANVTPLHSAPYNLTGEGVTITFFELGPAESTHREFEGRLTTHFPAGANTSDHATHVAGTMAAAGIDPRAKGMAPDAVVHQYFADSNLDFLDLKETELPRLRSAGDNNSWGYVFGWCRGKGPCPDGNWVWFGDEDLIGGYFVIDAALDAIAREQNVLMLHSAGNDGQNPGPVNAPFEHLHDIEGSDEDVTFCYSEDGSGTDCPTHCMGTDSQNNPKCEITRHPVNAPFTSIGMTASSKNVIAVGATDGSKLITGYSSRGPTRDGRIKPDVVARGGVGGGAGAVYSSLPPNSYGPNQGTSMATPVVTGITALLTQQWRMTFAGADPRPDTVKALLIATAEDRGNPGPDYTYGFGFVNAQAAVDTIIADNATGSRIKTGSVPNGQEVSIPLTVSSAQNLRVTLVWSDPEILFLDGEYGFPALVNDLDLRVVDAAGSTTLPFVLNPADATAVATQGVNTRDNVEVVEIANAAAGNYRIVVAGKKVSVDSPQDFSVVANAGLGAIVPPCVDVYEPNETEAASVLLVNGQPVSGAACSATDVDTFRARVTATGTVNVSITAGDTPLRVSLSGAGISAASVDVAAGATSVVTAAVNQPGGGTDVFVRVVANGTIGSDPTYRLAPAFPVTGAMPRRGVRH
jgi:hypothetical protein